MYQICSRLCLRLASHIGASTGWRALSTGLALGLVFWLIGVMRPGDGFASAMGLLVMFSGSVSFVLFTMATVPASSNAIRSAQLRHWVVSLGAGLLLSINGLDALLR